MSEATLQIGNGKWGVKSGNLLGYHTYQASNLKYLPNELSFSRASTATRVAENGLIEEVASGVPRIDYTGGGCGKLLLEPQRTNRFTHSENINNFSSLGRLNCGYSLGSSFASFGTSCLITSTSFTGSFIKAVLQFNSIDTENNYFTIRIKKKSGWYLEVQGANACSFGILSVNLASGGGYISSFGTMQTDYKVIEFDEYFEIGFKTTQTSTTSAGLVNLNLYDNASFSNYNDAGGTTFNISGIQWENQQTYGTSYIPTSGAAVTRVKDASITSGVSSIIGQAEGTIVLEVSVFDVESVFGARLTLSDGTSSNRVSIIFKQNNDLSFLIVQGGSVVDEFGTTYNNGETYKIAIRYATNDFKAYVNGIEVADNTSVTTFSPGVLSEVRFDDGFSSNFLYGNVQSLQLYQTALSDAELETLTTI